MPGCSVLRTWFTRWGLWLLLLLCLSPVARTLAAGQITVGVVPVDPTLADAAALLTAGLGLNEEVRLVERGELQRVLAEQTLSAASDQLIKLGRLLRADGLLVVESVHLGGRTLIQCRLLAVAPGINLSAVSADWPAEDLVSWSRIVTQHFAPYWRKVATPPAELIRVSLMSLRSAVETPAANALDRELTGLLMHRLLHVPRVVVTERQSLEWLAKEKQLDESEDAFWHGGVLLEGTINRDRIEPGTLTIHARFTRPQHPPHELLVEGQNTDRMQLIEKLVQQLLTALDVPDSSPDWSAAAEANRFLEEARWALRWHQYPEAYRAASSAGVMGGDPIEVDVVRVRACIGLSGLSPDAQLARSYRESRTQLPLWTLRRVEPILYGLHHWLMLAAAASRQGYVREEYSRLGEQVLAGATLVLHRAAESQSQAAADRELLSAVRFHARLTARLLMYLEFPISGGPLKEADVTVQLLGYFGLEAVPWFDTVEELQNAWLGMFSAPEFPAINGQFFDDYFTWPRLMDWRAPLPVAVARRLNSHWEGRNISTNDQARLALQLSRVWDWGWRRDPKMLPADHQVTNVIWAARSRLYTGGLNAGVVDLPMQGQALVYATGVHESHLLLKRDLLADYLQVGSEYRPPLLNKLLMKPAITTENHQALLPLALAAAARWQLSAIEQARLMESLAAFKPLPEVTANERATAIPAATQPGTEPSGAIKVTNGKSTPNMFTDGVISLEAVRRLDANRDGRWEGEELKHLRECANAQASAWMVRFDRNHDGALDFAEWVFARLNIRSEVVKGTRGRPGDFITHPDEDPLRVFHESELVDSWMRYVTTKN